MPTIRPASETDVPAITAIYRPAVLEGLASFELEPPGEAEMLVRLRAIVGGGYPYIVAEDGGRAVGYAYAAAYRTRPAYRFTVEDSVYVDRQAQGRGVGAALLDELLSRCTARGYRQMIAVIGDSLNLPSIALHRRAGFTFCGTIHAVGWKHGRWLDSVLMQKPLGPGEGAPPSE